LQGWQVFFSLFGLAAMAGENHHGREWVNKKLVGGHDDFSRLD
jgi:hypothetical protein